jgi:hypothetical protein
MCDTCTAHLFFSRVDHPNNIGWEGQVIKLIVMQFSPAMFSFVFFMS